MKVYMPLASSAKKPEKTTGFLQFHFDENHWISTLSQYEQQWLPNPFTQTSWGKTAKFKMAKTPGPGMSLQPSSMRPWTYICTYTITAFPVIYTVQGSLLLLTTAQTGTYKLGAWCVGRTPVLSVTKVGGLGGGINGAVIKLENLHVKNVQISERVTVPPGVAILPQRLIRQVVVLQGTGLCNRHTISSSCK